MTKVAIACLALSILAGCATRTATVVDTSSDWVRLSSPVRARVMTYQGKGVWAEAGVMLLPAGWFCGPGPRK